MTDKVESAVQRSGLALEPAASSFDDSAPAEVFSRSREGDREAFDRVVNLLWDPVMRFFWKRCPLEEAQDLSQDVFVSLYRSVRSGGGPAEPEFGSWLRYVMTAARNRLLDAHRRRVVRPVLESLEPLFDDGDAPEFAASSAASPTAAEELVTIEQRQALRDCLGRLDVEERAICWLHFVESKSKRQIAEVLRRPESTVRALMIGVLRSLRACMGAKGQEPSS